MSSSSSSQPTTPQKQYNKGGVGGGGGYSSHNSSPSKRSDSSKIPSHSPRRNNYNNSNNGNNNNNNSNYHSGGGQHHHSNHSSGGHHSSQYTYQPKVKPTATTATTTSTTSSTTEPTTTAPPPTEQPQLHQQQQQQQQQIQQQNDIHNGQSFIETLSSPPSNMMDTFFNQQQQQQHQHQLIMNKDHDIPHHINHNSQPKQLNFNSLMMNNNNSNNNNGSGEGSLFSFALFPPPLNFNHNMINGNHIGLQGDQFNQNMNNNGLINNNHQLINGGGGAILPNNNNNNNNTNNNNNNGTPNIMDFFTNKAPINNNSNGMNLNNNNSNNNNNFGFYQNGNVGPFPPTGPPHMPHPMNGQFIPNYNQMGPFPPPPPPLHHQNQMPPPFPPQMIPPFPFLNGPPPPPLNGGMNGNSNGTTNNSNGVQQQQQQSNLSNSLGEMNMNMNMLYPNQMTSPPTQQPFDNFLHQQHNILSDFISTIHMNQQQKQPSFSFPNDLSLDSLSISSHSNYDNLLQQQHHHLPPPLHPSLQHQHPLHHPMDPLFASLMMNHNPSLDGIASASILQAGDSPVTLVPPNLEEDIEEEEEADEELKKKLEKIEKYKQRPLLPPPSREHLRDLNDHAYDIFEKSKCEENRGRTLVSRLQSMVSKTFSHTVKLHLFGSSANGMSLKGGDIDICMLIDNSFGDTDTVIEKLATMLKQNHFTKVLAIPSARVPIVKFKDQIHNLSCDICINNKLAIYNTRLVEDYSRIDDRMRPLVYVVKRWAKRRKINEPFTGTLSSYAYINMVISFLQSREPPVLPCLQQLANGATSINGKVYGDHLADVMVDGYNCKYYNDLHTLSGFGKHNKETLGELVFAFFEHYARKFNYVTDVVSIRNGHSIPKTSKTWESINKKSHYYFSIEDPFEITHNLARVVKRSHLTMIIAEFNRAYKILSRNGNLHIVCREYINDDNNSNSRDSRQPQNNNREQQQGENKQQQNQQQQQTK